MQRAISTLRTNTTTTSSKYSAAGVTSVVNVGSPGGTALSYPCGVVVDAAGDLYIADSSNSRIVEYSAAGVASVVVAPVEPR